MFTSEDRRKSRPRAVGGGGGTGGGGYNGVFVITFKQSFAGASLAEQIDYVGYGIDSGPLPPMYYTRKELIAQPDRITVKRWTGMEAPFEESFPLTANQFQQIVDALTHYGIRSRQLEIPEGEPPPSGGGSEWVVVKAQDMLLMKGGVEVEGDVKQLVQLLESFVPEEGRPRSPLME